MHDLLPPTIWEAWLQTIICRVCDVNMITLDYYTATTDFTTPDLARAFPVSNCKYQTCLISTIPRPAASDHKEQSKKSVGSLTLHTFCYKRRL